MLGPAARAQVGRLAVAIANHPDIFPINFVVDHASVVFRTAEGTKLAGAVLGQAVAFEVDGYDARSGEAWSVVIKGRARELELMQDLFEALDLPLFPWHAAPKHALRPHRARGGDRAPVPRGRADRRPVGDRLALLPSDRPGSGHGPCLGLRCRAAYTAASVRLDMPSLDSTTVT